MRRKPYLEPDFRMPDDAEVTIPDEDVEGWKRALAGMGEEFIDKFLASKNVGYWNRKKRMLMDQIIHRIEEKDKKILSPKERKQVQKEVELLMTQDLIESAGRNFDYEI